LFTSAQTVAWPRVRIADTPATPMRFIVGFATLLTAFIGLPVADLL
jgi:hypothetical protein